MEKDIENKIKDYLFENNYYYFKVHGSKFMQPGIPDIVACINGLFVGIEVKTKIGIQSDAQKIHERNILASGGHYILARSLEEVIEYVERL